MSCEALTDAAGLKKYRLVSSSGYSAEVRVVRRLRSLLVVCAC